MFTEHQDQDQDRVTEDKGGRTEEIRRKGYKQENEWGE